MGSVEHLQLECHTYQHFFTTTTTGLPLPLTQPQMAAVTAVYAEGTSVLYGEEAQRWVGLHFDRLQQRSQIEAKEGGATALKHSQLFQVSPMCGGRGPRA